METEQSLNDNMIPVLQMFIDDANDVNAYAMQAADDREYWIENVLAHRK